MSILSGTIFDSNCRIYRDATSTDISEGFNVVEGPFLVDDGLGDFEAFEVLGSFIDIGPGNISEFESVDDHISEFEAINKQLSAFQFRPSGIGPITAIIELNDVIYVARTLADNSGAQLYKTTDLFGLTTDVAWEPIDMGYEVSFIDGVTKPRTVLSPQFVGEVPTFSSTITNKRPQTGASIPTVASQTGTDFPAWQNIAGLSTPDTNAVTSATLSSSTLGEKFSQTLQLRNFVTEDDADPNVGVVGIEVNIKYKQEVHAPSGDSPYGLLSKLSLLNVGGSDNKGNPATQIPMTIVGTPASFGNRFETADLDQTYGGATDTWNAVSLDTSKILSPDFGIEIEMGARIGSSSSSVSGRRSFFINDVTLKLYLEDGTDIVYFWDGVTDIAEATLVEAQKTEGLWQNSDAKGWMTLYDVTNPAAIVSDLEVRTAADGSGSLIATTSAAATRNLLPSWEEMKAESSFAQHIKANFFIDSAKKAVYGVTGASPAYVYDGDYFRFIHAPIPLDKDKPRHIAEHESHLVLAYPSGSILISVVGQPTNFSGIDGAVEFGFGDTITDLVPLKGSALGVLCQESANALVGNVRENFTTQVISKTSGAIEYSAVIMGQPIYADFRGISAISSTDQYGDFSAGRLSQRVTELVQGRTQDISGISVDLKDIVCAIPVRNKNQYRLYFNDGFILTMTLFGAQDESPIFTVQKYGATQDTILSPSSKYVPTAILSTVLTNGSELLMMGNSLGDVYVIDRGTGILTGDGIEEYYASLTFTPFNGGEPHTNLKYNEIILHGKTSGGQELVTSAGVNYLVPDPTTETDEITMGQLDSGFYLQRVPQKKSTHLPNVTSGFSLKIETQADGNVPHSIQALTFRPTLVGDQSNGQKRYVGPVDTDI